MSSLSLSGCPSCNYNFDPILTYICYEFSLFFFLTVRKIFILDFRFLHNTNLNKIWDYLYHGIDMLLVFFCLLSRNSDKFPKSISKNIDLYVNITLTVELIMKMKSVCNLLIKAQLNKNNLNYQHIVQFHCIILYKTQQIY